MQGLSQRASCGPEIDNLCGGIVLQQAAARCLVLLRKSTTSRLKGQKLHLGYHFLLGLRIQSASGVYQGTSGALGCK